MTTQERAYELQILLSKNKLIEALDQYYHEDVVVLEVPTGEQRHGKQAQKESVLHWMGMVAKFHKRGLYSLCVDEERSISTAETWMLVSFHDGQQIKMEEVAIQHWEDGLIVEEKFYYHLPEDEE